MNIRIYGDVQGVMFRDAARRYAAEFQIAGFVRNDADGSVYIEAEGDEEKLRDFLDWCAHGPRFARVLKIQHESTPEVNNFSDFVIQ